MDGIIDVSVSLADRTAFVTHKANVEPERIVEIINTKHLGASVKESGVAAASSALGSARTTAAICVVQVTIFGLGAACMFLVGECSDHCHDVYAGGDLNGWEVTAVVMWGLCVGLSFKMFQHAALSCMRLRPNMEALMSVAVVGSIALGDWLSAALVAVIVKVLELISDTAIQYIDRMLKAMVVTTPEEATLTSGATIKLADIAPGTELVVRVGEVIPVDGRVTAGEATVDISKVTGEATPLLKQISEEVMSGAVVVNGYLHVESTSSVQHSFQGNVAHAVDRARGSSSHTQQLVSVVATWYTPAVILLAAIVAAVELSFRKFLLILVAGCPCSLLGAAPLVYGTAIAVLADRHQVLLKNANMIETLATIKIFGMDKTGTLTRGEFELVDLKVFGGFDEDTVHRWAAAVESADNHPIARSIVKSYSGCLILAAQQLETVREFEREGRCGVRGDISGRQIGVGNTDFLRAEAAELHPEANDLLSQWASRGSVVFVTVDGQVAGMLLLSDSIRPESSAVVKSLNMLGVKTVMLTGDNIMSANAAAAQVGISQVHAELLPTHKAEWIQQASHAPDVDFQAVHKFQLVVTGSFNDEEAPIEQKDQDMGPMGVGFIGDGLNDCVALARAHVGIAMREVAESALVDASDAVLQGTLAELPSVIIFARRVRWLVLFNIALAAFMNLAVIVASIAVEVPLWMGVICDNGGLLIVLANSLWPLCWNISAIDPCVTSMLHSDQKLTYKQRKAIQNKYS